MERVVRADREFYERVIARGGPDTVDFPQFFPDDAVAAMLYLLDAEFVTGETIVVDGGRRIRK